MLSSWRNPWFEVKGTVDRILKHTPNLSPKWIFFNWDCSWSYFFSLSSMETSLGGAIGIVLAWRILVYPQIEILNFPWSSSMVYWNGGMISRHFQHGKNKFEEKWWRIALEFGRNLKVGDPKSKSLLPTIGSSILVPNYCLNFQLYRESLNRHWEL